MIKEKKNRLPLQLVKLMRSFLIKKKVLCYVLTLKDKHFFFNLSVPFKVRCASKTPFCRFPQKTFLRCRKRSGRIPLGM